MCLGGENIKYTIGSNENKIPGKIKLKVGQTLS
jgi:hypothetical protein